MAEDGRGATAPLSRFLVLYAALFAAFGVASPFLPGLLEQRGLGPAQIGTVLAAGTAVRLIAGPVGCRLADRLAMRRGTLALLTAASSAAAMGYLLPGGFAALLMISLLHSALLAPIVPLADALTLLAAPGRFNYGWVRGAGSAAFIVGAVGAGQGIESWGLVSIVWLNFGLLALAAMAAMLLPRAAQERTPARDVSGAFALLRLPNFVRLMAAAALILGSHALHDGFEVLRWRDAGIGPGTAGLLWSEAVAAEVVVFLFAGQALLRRLGPRRAVLLAAGAGILRWSVTAVTAWLPAMALVEPLHGLTFALLHLACMGLLASIVPSHLAATAQAVYGTVAVGAMSALLTLISGPLYGWFGPGAFWVMATLCAAAIPLAMGLPRPPAQMADVSRTGRG